MLTYRYRAGWLLAKLPLKQAAPVEGGVTLRLLTLRVRGAIPPPESPPERSSGSRLRAPPPPRARPLQLAAQLALRAAEPRTTSAASGITRSTVHLAHAPSWPSVAAAQWVWLGAGSRSRSISHLLLLNLLRTAWCPWRPHSERVEVVLLDNA